MKKLQVRFDLLPPSLMASGLFSQDIFPPNDAFFKHFLDLLRRIFVYDSSQRITAKQALNHPWFREVAQSDDGTEAAKIRMEKERLEQAIGQHTPGV